MKFKEIKSNKYNSEISISKLHSILSSWNDSKEDENLVMFILDTTKPKVLFGCAYNTEHKAFRFAASAFKNNIISPIYYYDVSENNIGLYGKYSMHNTIVYIKNKLYERVENTGTIINSDETLNEFIDKIQTSEELKNAELRINNICDLVLCEAIGYFGNNPYKDAHTATLRLGEEWDYTEKMNKILTLVKDAKGNIKNVNIGLEVFNRGLTDRLAYLKNKRELLINQIDIN